MKQSWHVVETICTPPMQHIGHTATPATAACYSCGVFFLTPGRTHTLEKASRGSRITTAYHVVVVQLLPLCNPPQGVDGDLALRPHVHHLREAVRLAAVVDVARNVALRVTG